MTCSCLLQCAELRRLNDASHARTFSIFFAHEKRSPVGSLCHRNRRSDRRGAGLLGPVSLVLYGIANTQLGDLGAVIGWPILSSTGILGANLWGALTGEWKGAGKSPVLFMGIAVTLLVLAMFVLGWVETHVTHESGTGDQVSFPASPRAGAT